MASLNLKIENDIAILEFDQPDSKVNVLNSGSMEELNTIIDRLAAKKGPDIKALIVTSRKDGIFIAGADIKEIETISSEEEAVRKAQKGKEVLDKLSNLELVTLAAINGACLGGGLEVALACKYRVASFSNKVKLGLPEVKLGIIPGFGGTIRLPRLVGLIQAMNMILTGDMVSGRDALRYGLVDRLFPETNLLEESINFIRELLEDRAKVQRRRKKKALFVFLEDTPFGRAILFNQAKSNVLKKTKGFYPAPFKALDVIKRTYGRGIKKGFLIESKAFGELAITDVSKNLIKVFYLNEEFRKLQWVDDKINPAAVKKCGVIGAGVMGGGIAQLLTFNDIPTRLKDINFEALKTALKTAKGLFDYALKKKILRPHSVDFKFGLISPSVTYKGFENADLVIEAVVEDLDIKKKVFGELSKATSPKAILASNTSSLPIIKIGEAAGSPERVIGLHFFNPVHRMPLVEIIRSEKTSDETLAGTIAFARRIGKLVIVVRDCYGFLINRILLSYLNEAGYLLEEGMRMDDMDRLARDFGMPMGPVELIDEIGLDVGYKVASILEEAYGERMKVSGILGRAKEKGWLGKKIKKGFYVHNGKRKIPNRDIYTLIKPSRSSPSSESALKRMIYIMVNEASRCLEERIADRPETIDIGMIMGTGFPPFRGGLLRYADSVGIDNIVKDLSFFEKELNSKRFKPCEYLVKMQKERRGFYGNIR